MTPSTLLGRAIGVIVCLVGVFILSLLVVTLTLFTDLDSEQLSAYKEIGSLSYSYNKKKEIDKYISSLIVEKVKKNTKKVDLDAIREKYLRNVNKLETNIYLKKKSPNKYTYTEFTKNFSQVANNAFKELQCNFVGMWAVEENVRLDKDVLVILFK